eukprot:CAMPEP_0182444702 /NCGR_PEP_ID=MMETSP1172-20130603/3080_1 /TAXON_ID=708627 /ORGANISM="Timspurckia oligopyrenoides, Strain CCMP3278" /LENGTH=564 /DNA_ID=CAMNT_0024640327 /DNA_START=203 /DNA_END=1897 /DNA_ORIENTATION=-
MSVDTDSGVVEVRSSCGSDQLPPKSNTDLIIGASKTEMVFTHSSITVGNSEHSRSVTAGSESNVCGSHEAVQESTSVDPFDKLVLKGSDKLFPESSMNGNNTVKNNQGFINLKKVAKSRSATKKFWSKTPGSDSSPENEESHSIERTSEGDRSPSLIATSRLPAPGSGSSAGGAMHRFFPRRSSANGSSPFNSHGNNNAPAVHSNAPLSGGLSRRTRSSAASQVPKDDAISLMSNSDDLGSLNVGGTNSRGNSIGKSKLLVPFQRSFSGTTSDSSRTTDIKVEDVLELDVSLSAAESEVKALEDVYFAQFGSAENPLTDVLLLLHNPIRREMMDARRILEVITELEQKRSPNLELALGCFFEWWKVFSNCTARLLDIKESVVYSWIDEQQKFRKVNVGQEFAAFERIGRRESINEVLNFVSDEELEMSRSSLSSCKKVLRLVKHVKKAENVMYESFGVEEKLFSECGAVYVGGGKSFSEMVQVSLKMTEDIRVHLMEVRPQRHLPAALRWTMSIAGHRRAKHSHEYLWVSSPMKTSDRVMLASWRRSFEREHTRLVARVEELLG